MMKKRSKKGGFTLVEIMIVVAIIGLLAAIAIPNFVRARTTAQENACINNLRILDAAKEQWALETNQIATATPVAGNLDAYVKGGTASVMCPSSATRTFAASYTIGAMNADPLCRILPGAGNHDLP